MTDSDKNNLPSEFQPELLHHYLKLSDDDQTEEIMSPLAGELKSVDGHYAGKEIHAIGGMKLINKVDDLRTGRSIAMAEMKKQGECSYEEVEQFLREARITAALEHPNIVPIYDIGMNKQGKPFFTMKFMKDESLKKIIRELVKANPYYTRKYTLNIILDIFRKVCDAVAFAHSCHVVHLDIKPGNIMIGHYGEVYICDWGLAKLLDSSRAEYEGIAPLDDTILNDITLTGVVKGTPGFMAPEQIDNKFGEKNEQTDIYALGALLYNILSLKRPYAGMDVNQTLEATVQGSLVPPQVVSIKEIPESLNAICMKTMATDQRLRYASVDELTADIRSYQEGFATEAENVTPFKTLALLVKRNKLLSSMLLLIMGTVTIFGFMMKHNEMNAVEALNLYDLKHEQKIEKLRSASSYQVGRLHSVITKYKDALQYSEYEMSQLIAEYKPKAISINFTDGGPGVVTSSTNIAGVVERGFWENAYKGEARGSTTVANLKNSDGDYSGVSYTFDFKGDVYGKYSLTTSEFNTATANVNNKMMENWTQIGGTGTLTFSGLTDFASVYEVIIYSAKNDKDQRAQFSIGNTIYFTKSDGTQTGPFMKSSYTKEEEAVAGATANYVRFTRLTSDTLTITMKQLYHWVPICGIQIVQTKAPLQLPEKKIR